MLYTILSCGTANPFLRHCLSATAFVIDMVFWQSEVLRYIDILPQSVRKQLQFNKYIDSNETMLLHDSSSMEVDDLMYRSVEQSVEMS